MRYSKGGKIKMVERRKGFQIMANVILIILAIFCLLPFILLIVSSFTDELTLTHNGYSFFPKKLSFDAYKYLLVDSTTIIRSYIISGGVTIVGTLANVLLTVLFAYPLSRSDLPGSEHIFLFYIFYHVI